MNAVKIHCGSFNFQTHTQKKKKKKKKKSTMADEDGVRKRAVPAPSPPPPSPGGPQHQPGVTFAAGYSGVFCFCSVFLSGKRFAASFCFLGGARYERQDKLPRPILRRSIFLLAPSLDINVPPVC
jgi:hypothetical protein